MGRYKDISEMRFGMLVAKRYHSSNDRGDALWECECDCGRNVVVLGKSLRSGKTGSCGCLIGVSRIDAESPSQKSHHGMSGTKQYQVWCNMLNRCTNLKYELSHRYGGRGIKVCERWHSFESFWEDMGQTYQDGLTINRIYNDGNYEPGNCEWATKTEQALNRRTNINIEIDGVVKTLSQWCDELGIVSRTTAQFRYHAGWDPVKAVTTPSRSHKPYEKKGEPYGL